MLHAAVPKELLENGVEATDKPEPMTDDFSQRWRRMEQKHRSEKRKKPTLVRSLGL
jgi:Txe/YoeB family toxin of Txe-Axe toxin-antitoxin module